MVPQPLEPNPKSQQLCTNEHPANCTSTYPSQSINPIVRSDSDSELICLRFVFTEQIVKEVIFSTQQLQNYQNQAQSGLPQGTSNTITKVPSKSQPLGWKEDRKAVRKHLLFLSFLLEKVKLKFNLITHNLFSLVILFHYIFMEKFISNYIAQFPYKFYFIYATYHLLLKNVFFN